MYNMYTELLNTVEKLEVAKRLAEIEASDKNACDHCGGEDCICCEIYLDRQRWQEPEEFFSSDIWSDLYDYREPEPAWVYGRDEWLEIPVKDLGIQNLNPTEAELTLAVIKFLKKDTGKPNANFEFDYYYHKDTNILEIVDIYYI